MCVRLGLTVTPWGMSPRFYSFILQTTFPREVGYRKVSFLKNNFTHLLFAFGCSGSSLLAGLLSSCWGNLLFLWSTGSGRGPWVALEQAWGYGARSLAAPGHGGSSRTRDRTRVEPCMGRCILIHRTPRKPQKVILALRCPHGTPGLLPVQPTNSQDPFL